MMLQDPTVRIPGNRREWLAEEAQREGIEIGVALLEQLRTLGAAAASP